MVPDSPDVRLIPTTIHGRVLVREARAAAARGILVGFHGYMENARMQMDRLQAISGAALWTLVSVQALHRFYRGRSEEVVASWMTSEDRDAAIADNIEYVDAALDAIPHDGATRIVYAGFSQGVAMAFRSAVRGRHGAAGVIGIGGDVPPELLADTGATFPYVLLARGSRDEWLTAQKFRADLNALTARTPPVRVRALEYDGGHEWGEPVAEGVSDFLESV
jgi:predicted esterase